MVVLSCNLENFCVDFDLNLFIIHQRYAHKCHVYKYLFSIIEYDYLIIVTTNANIVLANKDSN